MSIIYYGFTGCKPREYIWSSSTIRFRPLFLFLPPRNHLPISLVVFLYYFSLQVCNFVFFFLGSQLSSILCICSLQFILYCANLSLIRKIPNFSLMIQFYQKMDKQNISIYNSEPWNIWVRSQGLNIYLQ